MSFLKGPFFSVSFIGRASILTGSSSGAINNDTADYNEEVSGNALGAGASINLNTEGFGLKVQPFFSTVISRNSEEYQLDYSLRDVSKAPVTIKYDLTSMQAQYSLGTRFINEKLGLMSLFSIDYIHVFQSDAIASGTQSGSDLELSNATGIQEGNIALSFGFGFVF